MIMNSSKVHVNGLGSCEYVNVPSYKPAHTSAKQIVCGLQLNFTHHEDFLSPCIFPVLVTIGTHTKYMLPRREKALDKYLQSYKFDNLNLTNFQ